MKCSNFLFLGHSIIVDGNPLNNEDLILGEKAALEILNLMPSYLSRLIVQLQKTQ